MSSLNSRLAAVSIFAIAAANTLEPKLNFPSVSTVVANDCSFEIRLGAVVWLVGGLGRVYLDGKWHSQADRTLALSEPAVSRSGTNLLGNFTDVKCSWVAGSTLVNTAIRTYSSRAAAIFQITFPRGASSTNFSVPNATFGKYGHNTDGVGPFAEFPAFNMDRGRASNSSFMTWNGGLQYHDEAQGQVRGGKGWYDTYLHNLTGLSFGPMVIFDENAPAPFTTAVVSPASNIRTGAAIVRPRPANTSTDSMLWAHGPSWELTSVPEGFQQETAVVAGAGVRAALHSWGQLLLDLHNTTRLSDPSLRYLGAFTDNGAFYDAGYWPSFKGRKNANAVFRALSESYLADNIPAKYLQLDDWYLSVALTVAPPPPCAPLAPSNAQVVRPRQPVGAGHSGVHELLRAQERQRQQGRLRALP